MPNRRNRQIDDDEEIADFLRTLGFHRTQYMAATDACREHLVVTVGDLRHVVQQDGGLRELFPQLGIRSRVQGWLKRGEAIGGDTESVVVSPRHIDVEIKKFTTGGLRMFLKDVPPTTTIQQLKTIISARQGCPVEEFTLIMDRTCKRMEDIHQPLSFYGVRHGEVLHVTLPFRTQSGEIIEEETTSD